MSEVSCELEVGDLKPHEITFQHAIEISPLIKERTIGPDMPEPRDEEPERAPIICQKSREQKRESSPKLIIPVLKPSSSLDYELVSATMILRDAEEKRKKHVRQQMHNMQEKQLAVLRDNAARLREQQGKHVQELIAEKQRSDAQIIQEAEKQTMLELQEYEQQISKYIKTINNTFFTWQSCQEIGCGP